jgi:ubiquinone/menaquinone biosynthesis C-methylase UbiE
VLDYDREAERYDATRGGEARARAAAQAIETLISRAARGWRRTAGLAPGTGLAQSTGLAPARVVDVACGTGIVTARLLRPGRSVIGIDRSAGMAAVAAARLHGRVTLGDAIRLPLMSSSVDAVTMVWLLHLLDHAASASALAEAGRVLRPGGLLITTVGKDDAAYSQADDDAAAVVRPVRARFDHDQTDNLDRVREIGRRHGLALAVQTTFTGIGQGLSPRQWRRLLRHDETGWTAAAGRERLDALCAALDTLPEQDRPRPDPVYQLVTLRKGR